MLETMPFDAADYIETEDDVIAFLEVAMEHRTTGDLARALATVGRAPGLAPLACRLGVDLTNLRLHLGTSSESDPDGLIESLAQLGLRLRIDRIAA